MIHPTVFHKEVMWDKTVRYVEMAASKEDDQDMEEFLDKKSRRKKKAADMRNRGSLFIDDICGFIGAHIKIDKGIINNGNESNCSYQK